MNFTEIVCPGLPEGVALMPVPHQFTVNISYLTTYTYSCIEGYQTSDELTVVCLPNGTLSITSAPNCTGTISFEKIKHEVVELIY